MSSTLALSSCKVCQKQPGEGEKSLSNCGKCKSVAYCSKDCQAQHWPAHRRYCGGPWWDNVRMRRCDDGSLHEGKMELITWNTQDMGWGGCFAEESDDLKAKFEGEMKGDEKAFFEYWPQGFRWTCCGGSGDNKFGCDHHGAGKKPCTCDYCKMGRPLTEATFNEISSKQGAQGLKLSRGPDPRSYNAASAGINASARAMLGLD